MYIYLYKRYRSSQNYLDSSEEGIYTCRMPDSTGRNIDVSVGIYRHGYDSEFVYFLHLHWYAAVSFAILTSV